MHTWLMRNLTLLAFLLMLGVVAIAGLALVPALARRRQGRSWRGQPLAGGGGRRRGTVACRDVSSRHCIAYGILLRFVALCDDIAAIRRQQTGTPSSLD